MQNNTLEIKKRIKELPQKLQDVLNSQELAESLRALAKKYKIYYDKWEILENEVMLVLLSVKSPQDLPATLTKLNIDPETANALLKDLVEHIFKPMRALLKESLEEMSDEAGNDDIELEVDSRAPQYHGVKPDPKKGEGLDKQFNLGEIPQIDDPYLEPIEL